MISKLLKVYLSAHLAAAGFMPALNAHAQEKKTYTLAIINLDAKGVSNTEGEVLSERLRTTISQFIDSPEYNKLGKADYMVVERTQMDKILEEFNVQNTGCVSDSCAVEFGRMLQVQRIVIGTVGKIGNLFTMTVRIVDVESGKSIVTAARDTRGSIEDVHGKVIPVVVRDLLGMKKKSNLKWYLIGGGVLAAGAGAAALSGGSNGGGGETRTPLPSPPEMP